MTFNLFDIIMLAVVLISVIIGYVRGAAGTILSLVGGLVSIIVSRALGNNLAPWIYENFFREDIDKKITSAVTDIIANGIENIGDGVVESLPDFLQDILYDTGIVTALNSVTGNSVDELAVSSCDVVQNIIEPIYVGIISVCATAILFIIFSMIISLLCKISGIINKIPIVGTANKIIGCVLGGVYGIFIVSILVLVLNVTIPFVDEDYSIREGITETSFLFKLADNVVENMKGDTSDKNSENDSVNSNNQQNGYYDDTNNDGEYGYESYPDNSSDESYSYDDSNGYIDENYSDGSYSDEEYSYA